MFDIRPETGGLNFADGAVPTAKGLITTRCEKGAGSRFSLSVNVPSNTRATVFIPKLAGKILRSPNPGNFYGPQDRLQGPRRNRCFRRRFFHLMFGRCRFLSVHRSAKSVKYVPPTPI